MQWKRVVALVAATAVLTGSNCAWAARADNAVYKGYGGCDIFDKFARYNRYGRPRYPGCGRQGKC